MSSDKKGQAIARSKASADPEVAPAAEVPGRSRRIPKTIREIGIVLIGVLLALLGEQAVDSLQWREKTRTAERNMHQDIEMLRIYSQERLDKTRCADGYLAGMERAILTRDAELARRLQQLQIPEGDTLPVPLPSRPWPLESWGAAQVGQIIDHIGSERYADYAFLATAATTLRSLNDQQSNDVAIVGTATYDLPDDPAVTAGQLAALSRLRASEITMRRVAQRFLNRSAELGIPGSDRPMVRQLALSVEQCNAQVRAARASRDLASAGPAAARQGRTAAAR